MEQIINVSGKEYNVASDTELTSQQMTDVVRQIEKMSCGSCGGSSIKTLAICTSLTVVLPSVTVGIVELGFSSEDFASTDCDPNATLLAPIVKLGDANCKVLENFKVPCGLCQGGVEPLTNQKVSCNFKIGSITNATKVNCGFDVTYKLKRPVDTNPIDKTMTKAAMDYVVNNWVCISHTTEKYELGEYSVLTVTPTNPTKVS